MIKLQDTKSITQLLAGLMAHPERTESMDYDIDAHDFVEKIHKIIFTAIRDLYSNGALKVTAMEIDSYVSNFTELYHTYNENEGIDYVLRIEELGEPENFDMHYQRIKKFSFLRECKKVGIPVEEIYDEKIVDLKEEEMRNTRFNQMTLEDMVKIIEMRVIDIKNKFLLNNSVSGHISDNVEDILDFATTESSYGGPQASLFLNYILRGSRKKKLFLKHGNTGGGKSRFGMANMAVKTIPEIWDSAKKEWIKTGANGRGVFISTELDEDEIVMPFLAYITDIDESLIREKNKLPEDQLIRLEKAKKILKASNLWFEILTDFDIADIESVIVKHIGMNRIEYVEFDYIHTSLKLLTSLSSQGVRNLREDQILLIMGISLKNLCNKYNIHIESATQLNDNQNKDDNMDQSWIRGSKALADKIDGGYILLEIRKKDKKILEALYSSGKLSAFGNIEPNISLNVYKSRGGKWKKIRIFGHFNMGTLRFTDLFCINYKNELITEIEKKQLVMSNPEISF